MVFDAVSMIVFGIYFWYVKDMVPLMWFVCISQTLMVVLVMIYVPESPKFLYAKGEYDKFYKALLRINKFNKKDTS